MSVGMRTGRFDVIGSGRREEKGPCVNLKYSASDIKEQRRLLDAQYRLLDKRAKVLTLHSEGTEIQLRHTRTEGQWVDYWEPMHGPIVLLDEQIELREKPKASSIQLGTLEGWLTRETIKDEITSYIAATDGVISASSPLVSPTALDARLVYRTYAEAVKARKQMRFPDVT